MLQTIFNGAFRDNYLALAGVFVGLCIALGGIPKLWITVDAKVFFSDTDPIVEEFNNLSNRYGEIKNIGLIFAPLSGDIFEPDTLSAIQEFTEEGLTLPYSSRIRSLTNYQYIYDQEGELSIEPLLQDPQLLDQQSLKKIKALYLSDPLAVNRLYSRNGHFTVAVIDLALPENAKESIIEVNEIIAGVVERYSAKYPSIDIRGIGTVTAEYAFAESSRRDMSSLVPLSLSLIIILLFVLLRSFFAVALTVLIILLSMLVAFGFKGYINGVISPMTGFAPSMILTIAVADCVHLLTSYLKFVSEGRSKEEALRESITLNYKAICLTSITTIIGFLCFNFSSSPAIRDLGNLVAFGVLTAWLLTLYLLPALIMLIPLKGKKPAPLFTPLMPIIARFVIRNSQSILLATLILLPLLLAGIPKNSINEVFIEMFDDTFALRRNAELINKELTGPEKIFFDIAAKESGGVNEPEYLLLLDQFTQWLMTQPKVRNVDCYCHYVKRLNQNMHGDDLAYYTIPDSRELIAQYLLLYESSADTTNMLSVDHSRSRIAIYIDLTDSNSILKLSEDATNWLKDHTPSYMHAQGVSMDVIFAITAKSNSTSMYYGTMFALILISIVITLSIGDFKLGSASMFTNLLPVLLGYGVWGYINGRIGLSIAMVATLTMGLVVDDTIHFLTKFQDGLKRHNGSVEDAILFAFANSGNAIFVTSIVFIASFSMFVISHYVPNADMGILTAVTIVFAMLFDLLILPAILYRLYHFGLRYLFTNPKLITEQN